MFKKLFGYFLQGLLIIVPVSITIAVFIKLISFIGSFFTSFGLLINPRVDSLIFFAASLILILIVGLLGSSIVFKPMFLFFDRTLEKLPLIKTIYSPIKDMMQAFVGNKKRFNQPVLITTNVQSGIRQMGFITQNDLTAIGIENKFVAVYMPHSYAISGVLLIVPAENITPLTIPAAEAMKFIVSGGVSDIDELKLPKENLKQ